MKGRSLQQRGVQGKAPRRGVVAEAELESWCGRSQMKGVCCPDRGAGSAGHSQPMREEGVGNLLQLEGVELEVVCPQLDLS